MALYAFDGTWQEEEQNDTHHANTNVARFYNAYHARSGTQDVYEQGIGTKLGAVGKVIGGAFGAGELDRLLGAYRQLCLNCAAGDQMIDLVGFSRGAASCLDFCNLIEQWHIKDARGIGATWRVDEFFDAPKLADPPPFRFVGLFDVVGAFGLAAVAGDLRVFNLGHHLSLPRSRVQYAFHAMALDENRPSFDVIRLNGAHEVWFRGVHSDVGGGDGNTGLNDITLKWLMLKAKAVKLPIADADIAALQPDPAALPQLHDLPPFWRPMAHTDLRHFSVRPHDNCRPIYADSPLEDAVMESQAQAVAESGLTAEAVSGSPAPTAAASGMGQ